MRPMMSPRRRLSGVVALGLLASLLTAVAPSASSAASPTPPAPSAARPRCTVSAKLVNSCRPWLGAESGGYTSGGFKASMLEHEARIGRRLDIVHEYLGVNVVLTPDIVSLAKRPGTMALVNWKVADKWADAGGRNSTLNAQIDAMARSIKRLGRTKIFLTVHHEPENNVSPGGEPSCTTTPFKGTAGSTAAYVQMWHNVRARFNALRVNNVVWVMNYMGWKGWNCIIKPLWPGNAYVDWVMFDPYPKKATWTAFVGEFYRFLIASNDAAHNFMSKPWGLAEFGYVGSSQAAAYKMYDDARRDLRNNLFPRLKAYVVWDNDLLASHDDRVGYSETGVKDPVEQAHYNAFANDSRLRGNGVAGAVDRTAPTRPARLRAMARRHQVTLTWRASRDRIGVTSYALYRGTSRNRLARYRVLGKVTRFTDRNVLKGTRYVYRVRAVDAAGNWSRPSRKVSARAR
ncbi:MAG: hypothetical protein JWQ93_3061 [Marmoricola sp.]|nr:hypothetical protein [Marmoricola sp.]